MDLFSKKTIQNLLRQHNARPSKKLGQNFLIDKLALEKIIKTAEISKKDIILEIGPGLGNLTQGLVKIASQVIAVEKDPKMVEILKQTLEGVKNLQIIESDILEKPKAKSQKPKLKDYKVVGNLPYYAALAIIMKFLEAKNQPQLIVATIQKEVAEKICSKKKSSLPAIAIRFFGQPEIAGYISKNSFWPSPKVDGAILKISNIQKRPDPEFNKKFFQILKAGFSHPRKIILNNLSKKLNIAKPETEKWLKNCKIPLQKRAEELRLNDWLGLVNNYYFEIVK